MGKEVDIEVIKVGLADEQKLFTKMLSICLDSKEHGWSCVPLWSAHSGTELLDRLKESPVDLLITELKLPGKDGIDLISEMKEINPDMRICILTQYHDSKFVKEAFQNGADGFILKQSELDDLAKGIGEIMQGIAYMGTCVSIGPQNGLSNGSPKAETFEREDPFYLKNLLTKREKEILDQIALAKNNKDIAEDLFISDQTVSVHRKNIMKKLNVTSTASLIKVALKHGLVS